VSTVDWVVLVGTLVGIVAYGVWKTSQLRSAAAWLRGGTDSKWYTIGLSIMATQASAITFLSTPGQGFEEGLGFVQFYFGVPMAMVFLSATMVPIYYRTRVLTAYEYLEQRFDLKTRQLAAALFLLQRGLGAGLSIYAPAIILSVVLGWSIWVTTLVIGLVVIAYTVSGGTRAVSQTQQLQMVVMLGGMFAAFVYIVLTLPRDLHFSDAVALAGSLGKTQAVDFSFRPETRYTFWSGITGGTFVALAYFGADQSQVQRYLSGESLQQTRVGLLFNGLLKVPMQLLILLVGVMVFVFFQFNPAPLFFNRAEVERIRASSRAAEYQSLELQYRTVFEHKQTAIDAWTKARSSSDVDGLAQAQTALRQLESESKGLRSQAKKLIASVNPAANTKDADYVFLSFVMAQFPPGLVGLLLAVILCAAMSATASALNALGSTTVVDFYKRSVRPNLDDVQSVAAAKGFTVLWGLLALLFAVFASQVDNLIQAVNILGSLFYGPTLGVFLAGLFVKRMNGSNVFTATLVSQALVLLVWQLSDIGFLWYNVIGCGVVLLLGWLFSLRNPVTA
jgi:solute:Na+ symporter, SSS family